MQPHPRASLGGFSSLARHWRCHRFPSARLYSHYSVINWFSPTTSLYSELTYTCHTVCHHAYTLSQGSSLFSSSLLSLEDR